jgi:hypothetical protein
MSQWIYSPEGLSEEGEGPTAIAPATGSSGRRLLVLDNGKSGAATLLGRMAQGLAARTGARFVGSLRKGSAATPCEPELLDQIAKEGDWVLTGTAD